MTAPLFPRCSPDLCVRCRKKFQPGDRISIVNIVERTGAHPDNPMQMGAWLSSEFEMAHVECADVSLAGRVLR